MGLAQEPADVMHKPQINPERPEPVLEYSLTGGMPRPPIAGFEPEPMLRIWDDGRVIVGRTNPEQERCEMQWPAERVQQLIGFIVDDHQFFDADSKKIADEIKATGRPVLLMDGPTTRIVVRCDDREHEVDVYALGYIGQEYPEVAMLQHLWQIEKRLKQIVGICQLGGDEVLEKALADVNRELKAKFPDAAPMTVENFVSASRGRNASITAAFVRDDVDDAGKVTRRINATWTRSGDNAAEVNVFAFSPPQR